MSDENQIEIPPSFMALFIDGVQLYETGHIHNETAANAYANGGNSTILQLMAGNGGAPLDDVGQNPELGINMIYTDHHYGFSVGTVWDDYMKIESYSLDTHISTDNSTWTWLAPETVTEIILDSSVERARVGCWRRVWVGATTWNASSFEEEQHPQTRRQ